MPGKGAVLDRATPRLWSGLTLPNLVHIKSKIEAARVVCVPMLEEQSGRDGLVDDNDHLFICGRSARMRCESVQHFLRWQLGGGWAEERIGTSWLLCACVRVVCVCVQALACVHSVSRHSLEKMRGVKKR